MSDMVVDAATAKQMAGQNFREGYNCSEAIVRAFRDLLKLDISDEALKMATGFGGGLGHAGCMCGALTGSVMVLGALRGRTTTAEQLAPAYEVSHEFHDRFKERFNATCCRVLNPHPFNSKDHLRNCIKITGGTAELLMKYMLEKGLID